MTITYVIVIWTALHHFVGIEPGTYPDINSCKVALAHKQYAAFNWGKCVPMTPAGVPLMKRHHRPVLHSKG
jgi:hypothetical protein